jgi:hypothetical protein
MATEQPQPGEISLHGFASLENRRAAPGKPNTFIFDTVFSCSDQVREGIASCRRYIGQDKTKFLDDVYEIRAKVTLHTLSFNLSNSLYRSSGLNRIET